MTFANLPKLFENDSNGMSPLLLTTRRHAGIVVWGGLSWYSLCRVSNRARDDIVALDKLVEISRDAVFVEAVLRRVFNKSFLRLCPSRYACFVGSTEIEATSPNCCYQLRSCLEESRSEPQAESPTREDWMQGKLLLISIICVSEQEYNIQSLYAL